MFIEQFEKSAGIINNAAKTVAKKVEGATLDYKAIKAEFKRKNPDISMKSVPAVKAKAPPPTGEIAKGPSPFGMQNVMRRPQGRFAV